MALAMRHTGIYVQDLDKALQFDRDLLGFCVLKRTDETGPYLDNMLALEDTRVTTAKLNAPRQLSPDGGVKVTFCRDPEGNLIELVEELVR